MRPKEVQPTVTEIIKNSEYWNKRRLNYCGDNVYFDQEIRTGECILCKKDGRTQKSEKTELHHLKYDQFDKLAWTIEVCSSCHWHIDPKKRKAIEKRTGRHIPYPHGKFYLNEKQRAKQKEEDERNWYKRYCTNMGGEFAPYAPFIHTQELYDRVIAAIKADSPSGKWKRKIIKNETMSDVASKYF